MKKILLFISIVISFVYSKERLVVLDPASVETIFMLGGADEIVGIAKLQYSSIYPEEKTKNIPSVGTFSNPSVEKIVSLRPSLVILSEYSFSLKPMLDQFKIKSIALQSKNLEDIKENILILAKLIHKEEQGQKLLEYFQNELQQLQEQTKNKNVIYLYSAQPLMAFNDNSLIADILRLLGFFNVSPKSKVSRPILSQEYILKQNPDMIILGMGANKQSLLDYSLLKSTKAWKQNCIIINDHTHELLRLSPKILDRIKKFKTILSKC
ncbi:MULTISPECIES: ABC transporter substrate-binding protein [unclassified Campylobacter]|uniref:ABC transporter substrate-binding protein n=1 Tax=unclassified Campylobacter TaxID=2593542 RepID=UPI000EA8E18F|nr:MULTISPECIES: helical backbone metal receptor [unclassified Campylobacter]QOR01829.1 ABC transporter substrate-binding protein [Campylobacter sp. 2014D-0216]RKO65092.1 ABC transporter substrate-binding protein [Campylobacter sp. P255]